MNVSSGSTIPTFRRYVTIFFKQSVFCPHNALALFPQKATVTSLICINTSVFVTMFFFSMTAEIIPYVLMQTVKSSVSLIKHEAMKRMGSS
jgi:hypothetical protein